jgi:hypothetical protein
MERHLDQRVCFFSLLAGREHTPHILSTSSANPRTHSTSVRLKVDNGCFSAAFAAALLCVGYAD